MRDLKIVLAIGIPLVLVAAGLWGLQVALGPEPEAPAGREGAAGDAGVGKVEDRDRREAVPYEDWPRAERPRGDRRLLGNPDRGMPGDPAETPVLTADLLRELLAKGDAAAWAEIERLLRTGVVEDPMAVQELLVGALAKGGNDALHVSRILPFLKDDRAREAAVEGLLALARTSDDPQVLDGALEALGRLEAVGAEKELADLARRLGHETSVKQAIYALAAIGSAESATELARLLSERHSEQLRPDLLKAIGRVGTEEMVAALAPLAAPDQPRELRLAAIEAMGLTRNPATAEQLVAIFENDTDPEIKGQAIVAMGRSNLSDELYEIRRGGGKYAYRAGLALGQIEDPEAAAALLPRVDGESDARIKAQMVRSLSFARENEEVKAKLRGLLASRSESTVVRGESARSLAKMGDVSAVEPMVAALKDSGREETSFQIRIMEGLAEMVGTKAARPALREKAVPVLREMTKTNDNSRRYWFAMRALRLIDAGVADAPR